MSISRSSASRIRQVIASAGGDFAAQPLEARQLMTYAAQPIDDVFNTDAELFQLQPPSGVEVANFGATSIGVGDLDGDGHDDFAVAAPGRVAAPGVAGVNGAVFIYSGATREVMTTLQGDTPLFGFTLLNVDDRDADGKAEIAIGSPEESVVRIYSAATGAVVRTFSGEAGSEFGYAIAIQRDVGQAFVRDGLIIGAPGFGVGGVVYSYGIGTGEEYFHVYGSVAGGRLGHAVAGFRDMVGPTIEDGVDQLQEVIVSAPNEPDGGRVYVFNGDTGEYVMSITGDAGFGSALLQVSHSGGFMVDDVVIGDPGENGAAGRIVVLGVDVGQRVLFERSSYQGESESFGSLLRLLGELNEPQELLYTGSNYEFAVGAPAANPANSTFAIYTLVNGALVLQPGPGLTGATGVGGIGDINADGFPDVVRFGVDAGGATVATGYSSYAYFPLLAPNISSPEGTFLVMSGIESGDDQFGADIGIDYHAGESVSSGFRYAVRNGVITALSKYPGVGNDFWVTAVGDDGTIGGYIGGVPQPRGGRSRLETILIVDGARYNLAKFYIAGVEGASDYNANNFYFKRIGANRDILIEEQGTNEPIRRSWLLAADHTLIYLWNGEVADQAADGTIVGVERDNWTLPGVTQLWTRSGGKVAVEGIHNVTDINDNHDMLGTNETESELLAYRNGRLSTVARAADFAPGFEFARWTTLGIDNQGRGVVRFAFGNAQPGPIEQIYDTYFVGANNTLTRLDSLITSGPLPDGLSADSRHNPWPSPGQPVPSAARITVYDDGDILINTSLLSPTGPTTRPIADEHGVRSVAGMQAIVVNPDGVPLSFRLVGGQWEGRALAGLAGSLGVNGDLVVFVDPKDGSTYAVTIGGGAVKLYRQASDGTFGNPVTLNDTSLLSAAISARLTAFTSADNRVHVVGLNDDGELVMFYQTGKRLDGDATNWEWSFDNVQQTHLEPQGQTTPGWVGDLTVYVSAWNGLNIAGLNAAGDVEVVWWAPGRELWSTDNLSKNTGLTKLVGGLTSYVTPWGGLNVAGIDTNGDLQVVWWVPGFESQWRSTNMTGEFQGEKLDPATVSSYVTPWGGLNIVGIDADTGEAVVYWWTPALTSWIAETMTFKNDADDPLPSGRLHAVSNGQQLNLFGSADTGEVIRLSWNPGDGATWTLENLSRISV